MIQRTSYFSGNVQGVGLRYTAQHVARGFNLTGTVRNLSDGRVELIAEGEEKEIAAFLEELARAMEGNIKKRTDSDTVATGRFKGFAIAH